MSNMVWSLLKYFNRSLNRAHSSVLQPSGWNKRSCCQPKAVTASVSRPRTHSCFLLLLRTAPGNVYVTSLQNEIIERFVISNTAKPMESNEHHIHPGPLMVQRVKHILRKLKREARAFMSSLTRTNTLPIDT
ncbi:hypothetical protein CBL_07299 [Carabus blaptoides fortunei]